MKKAIFILLILGLGLSACEQETRQADTLVPAVTRAMVTPDLPASTPSDTRTAVTSGPAATTAPRGFDPSHLGTTQRDITYCATSDELDLKMDVYYPSEGSAPFPAVLYVHGGSWVAGNKTEGAAIKGRTELVKGGNVFVSIDYRLAPRYRFPAQIQDVKCAVRSLRANAELLGIDPQRIAAMGSSAGGHLVSLLGTSDQGAGWDEKGQFSDYSSRVSGVVDLFGPAVPEGELSNHDLDLLREVFDAKSQNDPVLKQYSPATYATPDDPPFLIIHGTLDTTVPLQQSQRLAEILLESGVDATLVVVENAGHGLPAAGLVTRPSFSEVMQSVRSFLDRTIGSGTS